MSLASLIPGHYIYLLSLIVSFSPHQWTALLVAAERGHIDIVRYLVGQGADINIKDKNGVIIASHVTMYLL